MQPHGSDRLLVLEDGRTAIESRLPKERWNPQIGRTLTHTEHPGTAILWDDCFFEVIAAEALTTGFRYVLEPWKDEHVIRVSERYDEGTETERVAENRRQFARTSGRKTANALGFLAGHLPARAQEQLGSELGILPVRLTVISTFPCYAGMAAAIIMVLSSVMERRPPIVPMWIVFLLVYLGLESFLRFGVAWLQNRPMGSLPGFLLYAFAYALLPRSSWMVNPFTRGSGEGTLHLAPANDVLRFDRFRLREPMVTFLLPAEQRVAEELYGYDFRSTGPLMAGVTLLFSILGLISSARSLLLQSSAGQELSLLVAGWLAVEQVVRLFIMRTRPAASILSLLARPFVRSLLSGERPSPVLAVETEDSRSIPPD